MPWRWGHGSAGDCICSKRQQCGGYDASAFEGQIRHIVGGKLRFVGTVVPVVGKVAASGWLDVEGGGRVDWADWAARR